MPNRMPDALVIQSKKIAASLVKPPGYLAGWRYGKRS